MVPNFSKCELVRKYSITDNIFHFIIVHLRAFVTLGPMSDVVSICQMIIYACVDPLPLMLILLP